MGLVGWGRQQLPKEKEKKKGEGPWLGYYPRQVQVPTRFQRRRLIPRTGYVAKGTDGTGEWGGSACPSRQSSGYRGLGGVIGKLNKPAESPPTSFFPGVQVEIWGAGKKSWGALVEECSVASFVPWWGFYLCTFAS